MRRIIGLLACSFIFLMLISPIIPAEEVTIKEEIISFTDVSKTDRRLSFSIPVNAKVSYFSFDLSGPEPGTAQPWNLTLDIGDNGTVDWALKQEYGPLGYQKVFSNGQETLSREFTPTKYSSSTGIYLPLNVEVSKSKMELLFMEDDYMSDPITELNRPEGHLEAPYDYDPDMCIYDDRLFVAYRSYNWHDTNQSDADIVFNSTFDGVHWQERNIELTKAPDTEVPYLGGKRSGDFYPSLAVFKGKLYCAWESTSPIPVGSTHGEDRDILWCNFDGIDWSAPHELTAPIENAAEDKYSENPGIKDDYRVQLCTYDNGSGEQLFAIWTANNTGDEAFPGQRKGDIVVSRTLDGETWTTGFDLTFDDRRFDEDFSPQLIEYSTPAGNALFAFWVTNNDQVTNGSDWDIVYRCTLDGVTWGPNIDLIDACGIVEAGDSEKRIDEDPALIVHNGELYIFWRTSNNQITNGNDIDIVMSKTSDGINWTTPIEVTPKSDLLFNNRPRATVFNNNLVVLWRGITSEDEGEIVLREFNEQNAKWSNPLVISPSGIGGNDYSPDLLSFKDQLYVSWVTQDNQTTLGVDADVVVRSVIPRNETGSLALDLGYSDSYNENWFMSITNFSNNKFTIDFTNHLQTLLHDSNWVNSSLITDEFQNEILYFPITTYFESPGKVILRALEIEYDYKITISDLSKELNGYLADIKDGESTKDLTVVLRFDSISNGKLKIENLKVVYSAPVERDEYPEIACIIIIGIVLIIIGVLIKISKPRQRKQNDNDKK